MMNPNAGATGQEGGLNLTAVKPTIVRDKLPLWSDRIS
jgi:hypothetical protein